MAAETQQSFPLKDVQSSSSSYPALPFDPTVPEQNVAAVQTNSTLSDPNGFAPETANGLPQLPSISSLDPPLMTDQNLPSSVFDQPIVPPIMGATMNLPEPITTGSLIPEAAPTQAVQLPGPSSLQSSIPEALPPISNSTEANGLPVVEPPATAPVSAVASAPISALLDAEPVAPASVPQPAPVEDVVPQVATNSLPVTDAAAPTIKAESNMDNDADAMEIDQPLQPTSEIAMTDAGVTPSIEEASTAASYPPATEMNSTNPVEETAQTSIKPEITKQSTPLPDSTNQINLSTQPKLSHPRDEDEANEAEPASKRSRPDGQPPALDTKSLPFVSSAVVDTPMTMENPNVTVQTENLPTTASSRASSRRGSRAGSAANSKASTPAPMSTTNSFPPPQKNANGLLAAPAEREHNPAWDEPITVPQRKHLQRGIQNAKKGHHAGPFSNPVDPVLLNIPTYFDIIKKPMDLKTIDNKLKNNEYTTVNQFLDDFDVMVGNSIRFNGPDHNVSQHGIHLRIGIDRNLSQLPSKTFVEPNASEKKAKKIQDNPPKRRESRSIPTPSAGSARSPTSNQTFALKSDGVPLIRRDSTVQDGRPRREIHPPASKDLPYSSMKPKRKKFITELKFCDKVYEELTKPKYSNVNWPFLVPVDPVALNIPQYLKVIKKPMDMQTIGQKLKNGEYENAKEFEDDFRLMINNCLRFNPPDHPVHVHGKDFLSYFEQEWKDKAKWVKEHTPRSADQSPESSDEDEEEEEDDEEEEVEAEEDDGQLAKLQETLAMVSAQIQNLTQQKQKKTPPVDKKKGKAKTTKKETKKAAPPPSKSNKKGSAVAGSKKEKVKNISWEDKMTLSDRINDLNQADMQTAMAIIKKGMPNLSGANDEELELDIDELPPHVLLNLHNFVSNKSNKAKAPAPTQSVAASVPATSSKPKKNRPMKKEEQEAKIRDLKNQLGRLDRTASGDVDEADADEDDQDGADNNDSSGDDDSEESEED